jgi:hypothetical protein
MKIFRHKKALLPVILFVFMLSTEAQNTNSAYSRYGYGVLKDPAVGAAKGMGGISYGIRGQNVNPGNPASYSAVDSLTFLFDIGISFTKSRFKTPTANQNDDNGGLDYLALEFPVAKRLAVSAGFLPYSSVGYSFGNIENKNGLQYQSANNGSGGLSRIYGGLSYRLFDNLSVGANVSYLYGGLEHLRTVSFLSETDVPSTNESKNLSINATKFDFGLQYQMPLKLAGHPHTLTLGAVYTPAIRPSARITVIEPNISGTGTDTINSRATVQLPHTFGLGFTLSNNRNLLYGADVTFQKWVGLNYPAEMNDGLTAADKRFNDRIRINAGGEYVIDPYERSFFKRIKFRGGLNYSNSYLNVKESSSAGKVGGYSEYGATLGFALPFRDNTYTGRTSYVNINFEYVKLRPEVKSMISEDYFGVSIGISLNDLWFMKNKFR